MEPSYQLPLSQDEFRKALKRGLGRALETAQLAGIETYLEEFLSACLENPVYDTQCEDSRTEWLARFFKDTPEWLSGPLYLRMCQLDHDRIKDWKHWSALCLLLARRGSQEAKEALYRGFRVTDDGELLAAEEIVRLDGKEGLIWVAERLEKCAQVDRSSYLQLLWAYDEEREDGDGLALLRAADNPRLNGFLRRIDRPEPAWIRAESPSTEGLTVRKTLELLSSYQLSRWAAAQPSDKLKELARYLRTERDPELLDKILFCFRVSGLPEYDPVLLQLSEYSYGDTARRARWILASHDHPEVRNKALSWLNEGLVEKGRLRALRRSFQMQDLQPMLTAVESALSRLDQHETHDLLGDVLFLAEYHLNEEVSALLRLVYEHTPCTNCRRDAVAHLQRAGLMPDWMIRECRFDCDEGIRDLVAE